MTEFIKNMGKHMLSMENSIIVSVSQDILAIVKPLTVTKAVRKSGVADDYETVGNYNLFM